MVFGVAEGRNELEVAPDVLDRSVDHADGVIDQVRAPVVQEAAAAVQDGLPVLAALEEVAVKLDQVNFAEDAGSHDLAHVLESRFQAAIMAQEKFAGVFVVKRLQLFGFGVIHGDRFFQEHDFPGFQGLAGVFQVIRRTADD